ncbi:uncharacterized protein EDB93DRAFT_1117966 [Suillus bovinus]|uniref:uncharacterized protein n=1 Tax=Suillus bovinus TaxID=48563 RepID=UPI001B8833C7|nr:uncharacterized protein EDB93DRAFT_1117966 [Suillus bovinus]KAG2159086.1 hypothetical protein EDB93DRAFT_1117966 [Suillus bovinus]
MVPLTFSIMSSSWTPDESPQTILAEVGWLQSTVVSAVAYGIDVALYFMCFHLLFKQIITRTNYKQPLFLLIYITVSFILGTLFIASLADFTQLAFIEDRNYPGGPSAFENHMFSMPIDNLGNVTGILIMLLTDALVVWRCMIVYTGCRFPLWIIMIFPWLMFAACIVMALMWLVQVTTTIASFWNSINFTIPILVLSLALNIIITIAVALRLLTFRYCVSKALGSNHGTRYISVAAMIIESAAIYSTFSVGFLTLFALNNPIYETFIEALPQVQMIAMLLIIFRVAQGKAWSKDSVNSSMTSEPQPNSIGNMVFASRNGCGTITSSSLTLGAIATYETGENSNQKCIAEGSSAA